MNVQKPLPPVWEQLASGEQEKYYTHIDNLFESGYLKYDSFFDEYVQRERAAKAYYNSTIKEKVENLFTQQEK